MIIAVIVFTAERYARDILTWTKAVGGRQPDII